MSLGASLLPEFDLEMATTRRLLERVPETLLKGFDQCPRRTGGARGLEGCGFRRALVAEARRHDRDLTALTAHVSNDSLVLWGWNPSGTRAPVSIPHEAFVASFTRWAAAGGPCPS